MMKMAEGSLSCIALDQEPMARHGAVVINMI